MGTLTPPRFSSQEAPHSLATSAADLIASSWIMSPDNFLDIRTSSCDATGDCATLRRSSPNGMLSASHGIEPGNFEYAVAWGGERCSLVLRADQADRLSGTEPHESSAALQVTTGTIRATGAGGELRIATEPSSTCTLAYVLLRQLAPSPSPPPLLPLLSSPPSSPPAVELLLHASPYCSSASNNCSLSDALVTAEAATVSEVERVRIELAHGLYDVSDTAAFPFDLGRIQVPIELFAAGGVTASDNAVFDAGHATSVFVLSLPSNSLTVRGVVFRNGNASRAPHHGGTMLIAAGTLFLEHCRFEDSIAPNGAGGALALREGFIHAAGCAFDRNVARDGGAIALVEGAAGPASSGNLTGCTLTNNSALRGGAASLLHGTMLIAECKLIRSRAERGGALDVSGSGSFTIRATIFDRNTAHGHGSAINYEPNAVDAVPSIASSIFTKNVGTSTFRASNAVNWLCAAGSYAPNIGAFEADWAGCPFSCTPGTYAPPGTSGVCEKCAAGKYQDNEGQTGCTDCQPGYVCREGAPAALPCPGGTYAEAMLTSVDQCIACGPGTFCSVGSIEETPCARGTFNVNYSQTVCTKCPSGTFQKHEGQTECRECEPGYYCIEGAATPIPCEGGTFGNGTGLKSSRDCEPVAPGFWAPVGSSTPEACFSGFYCPGAPLCLPRYPRPSPHSIPLSQ
jgi:hypothetical protein